MKKIGMEFEQAIFNIIHDNISDHRKRQDCLKRIISAVKQWGKAGQLPIPAQPQEFKVRQKPAHNSTMAEIADTICGFYSTNPRLSKFDIETLSRIEQQLRQ